MVLLLSAVACCAGCNWNFTVYVPLGLGGNVGVFNPLGAPSYSPIASSIATILNSLPAGLFS